MLHIARVLGLTDIRLVSTWSNGAKRTGKVRSERGERISPRTEEREKKMQLNR